MIKVKQLEWVKDSNVLIARTPFGNYGMGTNNFTCPCQFRPINATESVPIGCEIGVQTFKEAKAAAQEHYDSMVLELLEPIETPKDFDDFWDSHYAEYVPPFGTKEHFRVAFEAGRKSAKERANG